MKVFFAIFICLALSYGCSSTNSPSEHVNKNADRVYPYSYLAVYNAVLAAAKMKYLGISENNDIRSNSMGLNQGITLFGWGDQFTVFVKMNTDNSTEVYIPMKPLISTIYFPHDWQNMMLDQIGYELRTLNSGKDEIPSSSHDVLTPSVR